jgi:serine/threonine protein kinase
MQDHINIVYYDENQDVKLVMYQDSTTLEEPNKKICVKKIRPYEPMQDTPELQINELLNKHSHPNILTFDKILYSDPDCYCLMVCGICNLDMYLEKYASQISQITKMAYVKDMLSAISYIHSINIVHLDLRTENFVIFEDGCKLIDFGMAINLNRDIDSQYIPTLSIPEHLEVSNLHRSDPLIKIQLLMANDCHALGLICYHLIQNQYPYDNIYFGIMDNEHLSGYLHRKNMCWIFYEIIYGLLRYPERRNSLNTYALLTSHDY